MSVFLPLRVELVTPDDLCSFNLLLRDFPRSRTAGLILSFGRPEISPAASVDRGALSGRRRLKDARRGAASAGGV